MTSEINFYVLINNFNCVCKHFQNVHLHFLLFCKTYIVVGYLPKHHHVFNYFQSWDTINCLTMLIRYSTTNYYQSANNYSAIQTS